MSSLHHDPNVARALSDLMDLIPRSEVAALGSMMPNIFFDRQNLVREVSSLVEANARLLIQSNAQVSMTSTGKTLDASTAAASLTPEVFAAKELTIHRLSGALAALGTIMQNKNDELAKVRKEKDAFVDECRVKDSQFKEVETQLQIYRFEAGNAKKWKEELQLLERENRDLKERNDSLQRQLDDEDAVRIVRQIARPTKPVLNHHGGSSKVQPSPSTPPSTIDDSMEDIGQRSSGVVRPTIGDEPTPPEGTLDAQRRRSPGPSPSQQQYTTPAQSGDQQAAQLRSQLHYREGVHCDERLREWMLYYDELENEERQRIIIQASAMGELFARWCHEEACATVSANAVESLKEQINDLSGTLAEMESELKKVKAQRDGYLQQARGSSEWERVLQRLREELDRSMQDIQDKVDEAFREGEIEGHNKAISNLRRAQPRSGAPGSLKDDGARSESSISGS